MIARCFYRPGGAEERMHIRDVHVEYMIAHGGLVSTGGALMSEDGTCVIGMFVLLECETLTEAEVFLADEPYSRAGLFASRTIDRLARFIPHDDPHFLERLLASSRQWIKDQRSSA